MPDTALFQIIIAVTGFTFLLLLMDRIDTTEASRVEGKAIGLLLLYTLSMFTLLIPATTRKSYEILGIQIPPIQVWMEAIIMGFIVSITFDIVGE